MAVPFLNALVPVLFCIALGWVLARRTDWLESSSLPRLVTSVGLPCLILNAILGMELPLLELSDTVIATVLVLTISAVVGALALRITGLRVRGYLAMLVNPNTGNLGLPLVYALLGAEALVHAVVISTLVQLSHFTLGIWLLSGRLALRDLVRSGSILALTGGLIWQATTLPTPAAALSTLSLLAGMTLPIMLLLLGQSLASIKLQDTSRLGRVVGLSIGRVALGAGSASLVIMVWPLSPLVAQTLLLQASMPVAVISYILATHYNGPKEDIAAVILVSLPLSLVAVYALMAI